jgi:hypothetical protein
VAAGWAEQGQRWRLLAPVDAVIIEVRSGWPWPGARRAAARLRALTPGTPVVLLDHRPGGRLRARRMAATGLMIMDHQYVALPSLRTAIVLAEDTRDALRWAFTSLVATPPGVTRAHAPVDAAVRFLRHHPGLAGWLAAGRVMVGRRA